MRKLLIVLAFYLPSCVALPTLSQRQECEILKRGVSNIEYELSCTWTEPYRNNLKTLKEFYQQSMKERTCPDLDNLVDFNEFYQRCDHNQ